MSERTYGIGYMKTYEDKTRCIISVHGNGSWPSFHQCHRKRGHGPDGLYCKIHDPIAVKKREDERTEKWRKRWEAESSPRIIHASTVDLIAELERRRPCKKCALALTSACITCMWAKVWKASSEHDKFKEAK